MNTLIQPLPNRADLFDTSDNHYSPFRGLFILEDIFQNAITATSELIETPSEIKIPLRQHQRAILSKMELAEKQGIAGKQVHNETIFTNIGILGDRVGVGKSLMVLSHIARMKNNHTIIYNNTNPYNSPNFFSIKKHTISDISSSTLVIVPHNLFRQWQDYIETQTSLKACIIKSKIPFMTPESEAKLAKEILSSDFTIVSNTIFAPFMKFCKKEDLEWKRVFIDEADSIHIVSTTPKIKAGFIWFISASWANILFNRDIRFTSSHLNYSKTYAFHPQVNKWLKKEMGGQVESNNYYYGTYFNMRSSSYFKDYISIHSLRGNIVLLSDPEFLESSIQMPLIRERIVECLASVSSMVVGGLISENIKNLLHAGDVKGALEALGASEDDNVSIIQAVNSQRQKELDNYKKTLVFKETLEYASPHAKETALKNLRDKIKSLSEQIKSLHDRIQNVSQELCGICYDDPDPATITPCCNQIFCGACILTSMQKNPVCPMCRAPIVGKQLRMICNTPSSRPVEPTNELDETRPLKKHDALLKLLHDNPTGKFLVFSRYDNPFSQISAACVAEGISVREVKGNKDVINATLHAFENGDVRVLFLNSLHSGAGLNIISATHVVLLHAMTPEEQKQIVGRAYRLGRTADLNLIKLLHPGENATGSL